MAATRLALAAVSFGGAVSRSADPLHPVVVTALERVLEEAAAVSERARIHVIAEPWFERNEEGGFRMGASERPDFRFLISQVLEQLEDDPAVIAAKEMLEHRMTPALEPLRDRGYALESRGASLLAGVCELACGEDVSEGAALKVLDEFLATGSVEITYVIPLAGVEVTERIRAHANAQIAPMTEDDRHELWRRVGTVPALGWAASRVPIEAVAEASARIEVVERASVGSHVFLPSSHLQLLPAYVVDALRLLGSGDIRELARWTSGGTADPILRRFYNYEHLMTPFPPAPGVRVGRGGPLRLDASSELSEIVEHRLNVQVLPEHDQRVLELALRRLSVTYERSNHEDRLIDAWVALEALFLGDGNQELGYKARMRIARLLGETLDDRRDVAHVLKRSYAMRSLVVHGAADQHRRKFEPVQERADETLDILRRALRVWLRPNSTRTPEELDRLLLE